MPNTESDNTELRDKEESTDSQFQINQLRYRLDETIRHRTSRRPASSGIHVIADNNRQTEITTVDLYGEIPNELALRDFREVQWLGVNLNGCDAHGADFSAAILSEICALGANLSGAQLEEAQMQGAVLCGADLTGANLRHANLHHANLTWCDFRGASLFATDLRKANLAWADLRGVDLRQANLVGAYYNHQTRWPAGFDPTEVQLVHMAESR